MLSFPDSTHPKALSGAGFPAMGTFFSIAFGTDTA
jgi:hypothetical protein